MGFKNVFFNTCCKLIVNKIVISFYIELNDKYIKFKLRNEMDRYQKHLSFNLKTFTSLLELYE